MRMATRTVSRSCIQPSHPLSAAGAFLRLVSLRPLPVLDFLAPKVSRHVPPLPLLSFPRAPSRAFGTTAARRETAAIFNPRRDEDGRDMKVEITPRASNRLREIMTKDANPGLALRITVESGGCHGFQYLMSLTTLPPSFNASSTASAATSVPQEGNPAALNTSSQDPAGTASESLMPLALKSNPGPGAEEAGAVGEDDTVFKALDGSEAKVVMDSQSLELLRGSKIDYTMELIGSQFKIVDNPLATSSCGCGTSFDIKA